MKNDSEDWPDPRPPIMFTMQDVINEIHSAKQEVIGEITSLQIAVENLKWWIFLVIVLLFGILWKMP